MRSRSKIGPRDIDVESQGVGFEILGLSWSGKSVTEIAEAMGLSYNAARVALSRAEKHLARQE